MGRILTLIYLFLASVAGRAQSAPADTILPLPTVEVISEVPAAPLFDRGSDNSSLVDLLSLDPRIYVKNYGPGQLATASLRGAGASHTAVLWNGFDIQNPMLGLTDLSLIPAQAASQIRIRKGGNSALWGNAALGGAIHLIPLPTYGKGLTLGLDQGMGSFGQYRAGADLGWGKSRFSSLTKAFFQQAENDFSGQAHARLSNWGLVQDHFFRPKAMEEWSVHLWIQHTERQIPPTRFQAESQARQEDHLLRSALKWRKMWTASTLFLRTAYLEDQIVYEDPNASLFSDSKSRTGIAEMEYLRFSSNQIQWRAGIHSWMGWINSTVYTTTAQTRLAVFGSVSREWDRWFGRLAFRQERSNGQWAPLAPALEIQFQPNSKWKLTGQLNRNYRLPTLNDLYWVPGGNPNLKAEQAWNSSLDLRYERKEKGRHFRNQLSMFHTLTDNWIIWLPTPNGLFSPKNIQQVWSRGLENDLKYSFKINDLKYSYSVLYELIFSSNQKLTSPNDASLGKQLIYVPRSRGSQALGLEYGLLEVRLSHSYTGKVFTAADHSASLPDVHLLHFALEGKKEFGAFSGLASFRILNVLDREYEWVLGRPMPGRSFEINLRLTFHHSSK